VLPVKDTCNESILNEPVALPRSKPLVKTAEKVQLLAQSCPEMPQSDGRVKSKVPPVAVGIVPGVIESAEGNVMVNVPVCSDVDAFTIDGLFTTLTLIVSPDVKN